MDLTLALKWRFRPEADADVGKRWVVLEPEVAQSHGVLLQLSQRLAIRYVREFILAQAAVVGHIFTLLIWHADLDDQAESGELIERTKDVGIGVIQGAVRELLHPKLIDLFSRNQCTRPHLQSLPHSPLLLAQLV
jgi:hypothetical protein